MKFGHEFGRERCAVGQAVSLPLLIPPARTQVWAPDEPWNISVRDNHLEKRSNRCKMKAGPVFTARPQRTRRKFHRSEKAGDPGLQRRLSSLKSRGGTI